VRTPYGIDIVEFPLQKQGLRSEFDSTYRKILVNNAHPDFERFAAGKENGESWTYYAQVVSKEAAFGDFILSRTNGTPVLPTELPDIGERAAAIFCGLLSQLGVLGKRARA
jgi:hypothetical protein